MKSINFPLLLILLFYTPLIIGQDGIRLNTEEATESYTLFETFFSSYLVDNCGDIVNEWNVAFTDNHVKLLPNGNIVYIKNNRVFVRDWDDNLISQTSYNANNISLEYEVIVLENGNFLCIAREVLTENELRALGYDINFGSPMYMDMIVEIDPTINEIVWQWNIKDHMIQDRSNSINNFGSVKDNPRKLDMGAISDFDWEQRETFMINGFDYNPGLDLIALSVRKMGEVVIIDHSTTTEEARGSTGGTHGHGGDALFRWGNPQNYERGNNSDRYLYFQHNPNWIEHGPNKGKIIMFNNGLSEYNYSSIEIIDPSVDNNGHFILPSDEPFSLDSSPTSINVTTGSPFFRSGYTSGAKVLPNGNIYVTVGQSERLFEINPERDLVWEYYIEDAGYIFRSEKYPVNYSGFDGKDLTPQGPLEFPASSYNCELISTSTSEVNVEETQINIKQDDYHLILNSKNNATFRYSIFDINGQLINSSAGNNFYNIDKSNLVSGNYVIHSTSKKDNDVQLVFIK